MNDQASFRQQLNDIVISAVYAEAGCEFDVIDKLVKLIDDELISPDIRMETNRSIYPSPDSCTMNAFIRIENNLRQSMRERLMEEVVFRPIETNNKEREL